MNHIMLDIETMGNQSYSAILSIGAVKFDIETGEFGDTFHEHVSLEDCIKVGLITNASTTLWWLDQSKEAQNNLLQGQKHALPLSTVLKLFTEFVGDTPMDRKQKYIWGNSPRFDCGILQNAYDKLNIPLPWSYGKERDCRTLVALAPQFKDKMVRVDLAHDALNDAKWQIEYVCETWKHLKK